METTLISPIKKNLSAIGLGCVTFGREIDRSTSFSLMDYAIDNGITFFDTAAAYGNGASEKIVGQWISINRPVSDSIIIATKILPPYNSKTITESVNLSLKHLEIDSIDLLYLHRWDATIEDPGALHAFNELIKMGKIKMLGVSNFDANQLENIIRLQQSNRYELIRSVQNNNNFAISDINNKMVQTCIDHDIKIVTYSPLGAGFLTGKYKKEVQEGTRFSIIKGHQAIYFNESSFQRLEKLEKIASSTGYTTTHLALAWALHRPHVTSVLVGGRSKEQLNQALSALSFYNPDIFNQLELIK